MKAKHLCGISVALMLLFSTWGCGRKEISQPVSGDVTVPADTVFTVDTVQGRQYLAHMSLLYLPWNQVRVPVSVKISAPKSLSISGTAEFVRGKSVMISLRFLGMEVVSVFASDTDIVVVDKINKRYISEPTARFLGGFSVTPGNLQDLLIGRPFVLGCDDFMQSRQPMAFSVDGTGAWSVQPSTGIENLEYGFWFEPQDTLRAAVVQYHGKSPVAMIYGSPYITSCGPMASSISIKARAGDTDIDATLYWNWKKAKWGDDFVPRQPKVPESYSRVAADRILKMFRQASK